MGAATSYQVAPTSNATCTTGCVTGFTYGSPDSNGNYTLTPSTALPASGNYGYACVTGTISGFSGTTCTCTASSTNTCPSSPTTPLYCTGVSGTSNYSCTATTPKASSDKTYLWLGIGLIVLIVIIVLIVVVLKLNKSKKSKEASSVAVIEKKQE